MSVRYGRESKHLFSSYRFSDSLRSRTEAMRQEVEGLESDRVLAIPAPDIESYLVEKYSFEIPCLLKDHISASEAEIQVDVSGDRSRYIRDTSRPFFIPGQRIEIEVPFSGSPDLFQAQANTSTTPPLRWRR